MSLSIFNLTSFILPSKSSPFYAPTKNQSLKLLAASIVMFSPALNALSLKEAIQQTLSNNPSVQAAQQEVFAIENEVKAAKSGYFPTLDFEAGIGRESTLSPTTGNDEILLTREELALRLRQVIYNAGGVSGETAIQKARYQSALYTLLDTQENAALRTTEAYLNVLRLYENTLLLRGALNEHKAIQEQMSLRQEAGVGSEADLNQVKVRLSLATSAHIAGESSFLNSLTQFKALTGSAPNLDSMQMPAAISLPNSLEASLSESLQLHPSIKSAKANIQLAEARLKASKGANHPSLSLEGDRTWNENIDGIEGDNEDWVIALRLRYNLFNGGGDRARNKRSASLVQKASEEYRQTMWQIEQATHSAWYAYDASRQQLKHLKIHADSAVATTEAYKDQYKVNKRNLIELLNAQNELVNAQQTYLRIRYEHSRSQFRVLNAQGQLTQILLDDASN